MTDNLPVPRYTLWQSLAVALGLGTRALDEVRALKANPPRAKFRVATFWVDGVHYEGDIVTHKGSAWQAIRDTGREPPHDDWIMLAAAGAAGEAPYVGEVCGLWDADRSYRKFDLVSWRGSEWRARRDEPGTLPGDGWALAGKRGSRGEQGDAGPRGERGDKGAPAPAIVSWETRDFRAVPVMSDGSTGPPLDLTELFEQYDRERR